MNISKKNKILKRNEILDAVEKGQLIVIFPYVVSFIFITWTGVSKFYIIDPSYNTLKIGWKYCLLTSLLGWWGFPHGLISTASVLNETWCGVDVTDDVLKHLERGYSLDSYDRRYAVGFYSKEDIGD